MLIERVNRKITLDFHYFARSKRKKMRLIVKIPMSQNQNQNQNQMKKTVETQTECETDDESDIEFVRIIFLHPRECLKRKSSENNYS